MHTRRTASKVAAAIIAVFLGSLLLQPATLHAETSALTLSSDEPPSAVAPNVAPEVYQGSFKYSTATEMLAALHVTRYPEDRVTSFPDPSLGIGSQVKVYRAHAITINDAGTSTLVRTWASTVAIFATEQRLNLAVEDKVSVPLSTPVDTLTTITITRVSIATLNLTQPIPFTVQQQSSGDLEKGVQNIKQNGKDGVLQQTFTLRRENGVEVSRQLTATQVLSEPMPAIVVNGTRVENYGTGGASWYASNLPPLTAANKTLPKGTKVSVVNLANGKSVIVTIADRGPYVGGRVIDLSPDAFSQIANLGTGVVQVRMDKVYPAK